MRGSRPLTDDEIARVLTCFRGRFANRNRAILILGIKTGFRISEILSLTVKDVLVGENIIVDRVKVERQNMKGKTEGRTILLHPKAKEAIASWLAELKPESPETYLFQSRKGSNQPISRHQAWRAFNTAFRKAGLIGQLGTHTARKTFCDRMYERLGRDLVSVQRAMGHRSISSTMAYLSFRTEAIDQAILST